MRHEIRPAPVVRIAVRSSEYRNVYDLVGSTFEDPAVTLLTGLSAPTPSSTEVISSVAFRY